MNPVSDDAVELFTIEPDDWRRWAAPIVAFEREHFPPNLREDVGDLRRLVESATSIVLGARTKDLALAGYIASDILERFGDVPGVRTDRHWNQHDTQYIAAVVVAPSVRHRGVATRLTMECAAVTRRRGFRRMTAHIVAGAAKKIDPRIRLLASFPNWYGTRQTFEYVEIPIEDAI